MSIIASAHNGGRTQVNFNYVGLGEYAFCNRVKTGQPWGTVSPTGAPDPSSFNFDADNYPRAIVSGGVRSLFTCETVYDRPGGVMKIDWVGSGTVTLFTYLSLVSSSGVLSGASLTTGAGGGWITFVPPVNGRPEWGITGVGSAVDYPHSVRAYFVDDAFGTDETDINAGYILSSPMRAFLAQMKPGRVRFLNWGGSGDMITSMDTTWALRRTRTSVFYVGNILRADLYAGPTTNSGDHYSITPLAAYYNQGALTDGQPAIVKWNASPSGNAPDLAWNGGAAKRILIGKNATAVDLTGSTSGKPSINNYHTIVYDATLDAWLNYGTSGSDFGWNPGISPEVMIDAAAEIGAHPDIPLPHLGADKDWVDGQIAYAVAHSASTKNGGWMIPLFEGGNEHWNNASTALWMSRYHQMRSSAMDGVTWSNGVKTVPGPYTATAVTSVVANNDRTGQAKLTIGAHTIPVGATVSIANSGSGFFSYSGSMIAKAVDATSITTAFGPNGTGPYTGSGITVSITDPASSTDGDKYYGWIMTRMGKKLATAFGVAQNQVKTQNFYRLGCGLQTSSLPSNQYECLWNSYGVLQAGDTNEAGHNWITTIRPSSYWNEGYYSPDANEATLVTTLNPSAAACWISAGNQLTQTAAATLTDGSGNGPAVGKYMYAPRAFGSGKYPRITAVSGSGIGAVITFDGPAQTVETSGYTRTFIFFDSLHALYDYLSSYNKGTGGTVRWDTLQSTYIPRFVNLCKAKDTSGVAIVVPPYITGWTGTPRLDFYEGSYSNDFTTGNPSTNATSALRWLIKTLWFSDTLPRGMLGLEYDLIENLINLSDASVTVEYPSQYQLIARWPPTQLWPAMVSVTDNLNPQVKAHALFNAGRRRLTAKT